jgi:hypothetical protein
MTSTVRRLAALLAVLLLGTGAARAQEYDKSKPMFEIYGFGQVDYIQDFNRVDPNWKDTLRPSRIPAEGSNGQAILSTRQSRLGVQGSIPAPTGAPVFAKFEFDMFGTGADQGQTTIRLRHAYGSYKQILGGQTNSVFMDADVFPDVLDYWGPGGMAFLRTPQLRWTPISDEPSLIGRGKTTVSVALENPATDIDTGQVRELDPNLGANITSDNKVPDITAHVRNEQGWGHFQVAAILRRLGYETLNTRNNDPSSHNLGWGLDLTSNIKTIGKDKLDLAFVYGEGIASYFNDGGVDIAPAHNGPTALESRAVPIGGILAYYDHWWSDRWESTAGYSRTQVQNQNAQLGSAFHIGQYASANLVYRPVKDFFIGGEFLWGQRSNNSHGKNTDRRFQVAAHYNFSSKGLVALMTGSQK